MRTLGVALVVGILAFIVAWTTKPDPPPEFRTVTVTETQIVESEPQVEIRWRDRIVEVQVPIDQVAESPTGGEEDVESFCAPTIERVTDTVYVEQPAPVVLLRSVDTDPAWWWGRERVRVVGPLSTGGLQQTEFRARPGWELRTSGDSVVVREGRFGWVRGALEFGVPLIGGVVLGRVVP